MWAPSASRSSTTVDESNLQRQIIHGVSDIGKSEGPLRQGVDRRERTRYVEVILHERAPRQRQRASRSSRGYDLIVDGTDNFATRYMVNDAAYFLGIPYVWGSIYRFDGQASVFGRRPT